MPEPYWPHTCIEALPPDKRLEHVRFCSPFAAHLIDQNPCWLEQLEAGERLGESSPPRGARAREWIEAYGLDDGLRSFRNQEMLRIIWRDLCGLATLGEVFTDLTVLAEVCLSEALALHDSRMREKYGDPRDPDGRRQQLVVLGLGKLGGRELNLSSDIDVIFCYPASGHCDGPRGLSNAQFFERLCRAVIATLADLRPSGFCFRVDTRLRPFGEAGPVCCSFAAMEQYYQREGREWERYALIKARPVAGSREPGERLLEVLRPFVYRRYIDFGAIEALRDMQELIRAETARRDRQDDIKRGPGGIREIEFLAQGFQLLRGGRERRLQTPYLSVALDSIANLGLLPNDVVSRLRGHYTWLRQVENRLQAMRDLQTHDIPGGEALERLCAAMGLPDSGEFRHRLDKRRKDVSGIFDQTWSEPKPVSGKADEGMSGMERWQRRWAEWRDGRGRARGSLASFVTSLERRPMGQRAAARLDRLMPLLLRQVEEKRLEDEVFTRLLDLILTVSRRSAYLALLAENPAALERTIELFGRSAWVAQRVCRFPELLDELIDPSLGHHIPSMETLQAAAGRKLELQDEEAILAGLNYLKQATCLRLAVAWLEGRISASALQESLTDLAEVMVGATLHLAEGELGRRHGFIGQAGVAIIAYGSLGSRELGFDSDLDLVFLYDPGSGESAGERPLAAERWFARLAQRVVALLTALTPSGKLYDIDTRLRPNGQSGLLVSPISAFETYQMTEAWTWEAQAMTRARPVAGTQELASGFEAIRRTCLCRPRDASSVGREILEMRERIRESHGDGNTPAQRLKHAPGGLVDIGFIAQLGILALACQHEEIIQATGAEGQLDRLLNAGWLDAAQHRLLQQRLAALRQARVALELQARPSDDGDSGEGVAALLIHLARR